MKTLLDYEPFLASYVPESGLTAIDIGANCGIWTRYLAKRFRHVYAFEPNPRILPELKNLLPANVLVYEVGLWSSPTIRTFSVYPQTDLFIESSFDAPGIQDEDKIGDDTVHCLSLDSLEIPGLIDFIKIDTEGSELEILRGGLNTIQRSMPKMVIEVHHPFVEPAIIHFLRPLDYKIETIGDPQIQTWIYCQK
jgi:FkbM family methyltransferase